jgi:hypothetical protein
VSAAGSGHRQMKRARRAEWRVRGVLRGDSKGDSLRGLRRVEGDEQGSIRAQTVLSRSKQLEK